MNAGDTYRRGTGHLWVILSDPQIDPNQVVVVNITENRSSRQDQSCILRRGEHPFLYKDESVVFYARGQIETNTGLEADVSSGQITPMDPVDPAILSRMRDGARESDRLPFILKRILEEQGLI